MKKYIVQGQTSADGFNDLTTAIKHANLIGALTIWHGRDVSRINGNAIMLHAPNYTTPTPAWSK